MGGGREQVSKVKICIQNKEKKSQHKAYPKNNLFNQFLPETKLPF